MIICHRITSLGQYGPHVSPCPSLSFLSLPMILPLSLHLPLTISFVIPFLLHLQVAWKEESNPSLGFDYLYLSEEDYHALPKGTVDAVAVLDMRSGETRWQLEAIIGQTHGIGVENLRYGASSSWHGNSQFLLALCWVRSEQNLYLFSGLSFFSLYDSYSILPPPCYYLLCFYSYVQYHTLHHYPHTFSPLYHLSYPSICPSSRSPGALVSSLVRHQEHTMKPSLSLT